MNTAVGRLVRTELTLMTREPLTVIFVFVFPVVTMLIIGGSFGTTPTVAFSAGCYAGSPPRDSRAGRLRSPSW